MTTLRASNTIVDYESVPARRRRQTNYEDRDNLKVKGQGMGQGLAGDRENVEAVKNATGQGTDTKRAIDVKMTKPSRTDDRYEILIEMRWTKAIHAIMRHTMEMTRQGKTGRRSLETMQNYKIQAPIYIVMQRKSRRVRIHEHTILTIK